MLAACLQTMFSVTGMLYHDVEILLIYCMLIITGMCTSIICLLPASTFSECIHTSIMMLVCLQGRNVHIICLLQACFRITNKYDVGLQIRLES